MTVNDHGNLTLTKDVLSIGSKMFPKVDSESGVSSSYI